MKRFEDKVITIPESACHWWTAALNDDGYGRFVYDDKVVRAHRFSYELYVGPIPEGLCVNCTLVSTLFTF